MSDSKKMRIAFENAAKSKDETDFNPQRNGEGYAVNYLDAAWDGWKSAAKHYKKEIKDLLRYTNHVNEQQKEIERQNKHIAKLEEQKDYWANLYTVELASMHKQKDLLIKDLASKLGINDV